MKGFLLSIICSLGVVSFHYGVMQSMEKKKSRVNDHDLENGWLVMEPKSQEIARLHPSVRHAELATQEEVLDGRKQGCLWRHSDSDEAEDVQKLQEKTAFLRGALVRSNEEIIEKDAKIKRLEFLLKKFNNNNVAGIIQQCGDVMHKKHAAYEELKDGFLKQQELIKLYYGLTQAYKAYTERLEQELPDGSKHASKDHYGINVLLDKATCCAAEYQSLGETFEDHSPLSLATLLAKRDDGYSLDGQDDKRGESNKGYESDEDDKGYKSDEGESREFNVYQYLSCPGYGSQSLPLGLLEK